MDPEYLRTGQLSVASDCFSFGVLMLQMLTGRAPHDRRNSVSLQVREFLHPCGHAGRLGFAIKGQANLGRESIAPPDAA